MRGEGVLAGGTTNASRQPPHRAFDKKKIDSPRQNFSSLLPWDTRNQDNLPIGRTFGPVSPRSENLALLPWGSFLRGRVALPQWSLVKTLHLDLEQGTPWTSDHWGGWGGFTSVYEKIFRNRFVRQDGGLEGGACVRTSGRPCSAFEEREKTKILREFEILQISTIMR